MVLVLPRFGRGVTRLLGRWVCFVRSVITLISLATTVVFGVFDWGAERSSFDTATRSAAGFSNTSSHRSRRVQSITFIAGIGHGGIPMSNILTVPKNQHEPPRLCFAPPRLDRKPRRGGSNPSYAIAAVSYNYTQ